MTGIIPILFYRVGDVLESINSQSLKDANHSQAVSAVKESKGLLDIVSGFCNSKSGQSNMSVLIYIIIVLRRHVEMYIIFLPYHVTIFYYSILLLLCKCCLCGKIRS